jgi:hypothetical protein
VSFLNYLKQILVIVILVISSLVIFIRQVIQDNVLMIRILKNCWFFLEITIKSICIYYTTYNELSFNEDNASLRISIHVIIK